MLVLLTQATLVDTTICPVRGDLRIPLLQLGEYVKSWSFKKGNSKEPVLPKSLWEISLDKQHRECFFIIGIPKIAI